MHVVVYTSEYVSSGDDRASDINDIVSASQRNNPGIGITGVMFFHQDRFLQFLEGEKDQVTQLMSRISADKRHKNVEFLFNDRIFERGLKDWNMDCFEIKDGQTLDYDFLKLIADGYRKTFQVDTNVLLGHFKDFLEND